MPNFTASAGTPGTKVTAGGITRIVYASFTRPNDIVAYTAGDVVADSTTQADVIIFPGCGRGNGGSGILQSVGLLVGASATTQLDADLFIFNVAPTGYGNDNTTFTPSLAALQARVACVQLPVANVRSGNLTAGITGNTVNEALNIAVPYKCADNDSSLYGVLIARNAYTPVALTPFYFRLGLLQD